MTATATAHAPPISAPSPAGPLLESLREVFAEVTRYPREILEPHALLEEDLGIDSVKLGEVFSVLRERYDLPEDMGLQPEQLATLADIDQALSGFLADGAEASSAPSVDGSAATAPATNGSKMNGSGADGSSTAGAGTNGSNAAASSAAGAGTNGFGDPAAGDSATLAEQVRSVFAEVTRYPQEILEPDALLEEDLGIDSVKLGEVFSVLRERYDLPEDMGLQPEQLSTLANITSALEQFLAPNAPARWADTANPAIRAAPARAESGASRPPGPGSVEVEGRGPISISMPSPSASVGPSSAPASAYAAPRPLEGRVAMVTGSGRGLGKEIVHHLASLGATVVVNSFHSRDRGEATAREIVDAGGEAHHIWGSVANPEHVDRMFDEVEERYEGVDFFVSNASNGMLARLEDITPHHWEKAFRTNIIGLHQGAMRAAAAMRRRGGGKIITLSSPAAHGYVDYFGCMGAVKAAVESLTRSMAIELADYGIQVNCVSPGPVYGELLDKWPESERLIPQWEANTAYPRLCRAEDVAHFVAYLLSDEVQLFTGSVLVMDGGISSQGW